jgi:two-component system sensor kinase FixL
MISTHWREPHQPTDRKLRSLDVLARQAADLIERGETEAALRESEQRFHWLASVVESSDDAIVSKNLNGDIRSWNAGAERLFGYAAKEMIGEPITILVPPSLQNEERLILEKIGRGERTDHYETVRQRKDGSPVLISLTVSPVKNAEGEIIGASKIARDMSERKRAQERESVLMAELSHMNRVATAAELTASIAHEVNQPLTGIATSAGAALRWLRAKPPETRRAEVALEQVVAATHRAGDIVGSLRMMFNKNIRSSARVDLNHLITTVLALVRADLQSNGIQLEEYLNEIPLGEGDAVQLQQVILNVVVNAIEAMRSTQLRTLKVNSRRSNPGKVYVSIEDTGSGIDPSHLERIFHRLFTTKGAGMGMGLAICRSIIEHHGGRIWASSLVHQGTIFQFELPTTANDGRLETISP